MKNTQNIVAISSEAKTFIADQASSYSAPSKSKDSLEASQREIVDAMHAFVEKHRYQTVTETSDTGEEMEVEIDIFESEVNTVLAARMESTQTRNTASKKLAKAEAELEELKAKLAALETAATEADAS